MARYGQGYEQDGEQKFDKNVASGLLILITGVVLLIGCLFWAWPKYRIYSQTMRGEADFREATINRKILVEQARAEEEALAMRARGEAEREVIKAQATSEAVGKIGAALEQSPAYLRWMWITEVAGSDGERVYIPTEAGMPILEAGR